MFLVSIDPLPAALKGLNVRSRKALLLVTLVKAGLTDSELNPELD